MAIKTQNEEKPAEKKFTKEQILASKKYADRADLLSVLIKDNEKCALTEVDKRIEDFKKGKVK